jgi:hypothetical protein
MAPWKCADARLSFQTFNRARLRRASTSGTRIPERTSRSMGRVEVKPRASAAAASRRGRSKKSRKETVPAGIAVSFAVRRSRAMSPVSPQKRRRSGFRR